MKKIRLSNRLSAVVKYVPPGASVIDVGSDHGFIPVYLAQENIALKICASDINRGPLDAARLAALEYGVADMIEFVQTDGLSGISPGRFDTVIIAGLGGELIASILGKALTLENGVRLILQPQSKLGALCDFLNRGFEVLDASLARDGGRIYIVLLAGGTASRAAFCDLDIFRLLLKKRDSLLAEYLDSLIMREKSAVSNMLGSEAMRKKAQLKQDYINELLKIRGDIEW